MLRRSKRCSMCHLEKVLGEFYARQSLCRSCGRIQSRLWFRNRYRSQPEAFNAIRRERWATDPEYRARLRAKNTAYKRRVRMAEREDVA